MKSMHYTHDAEASADSLVYFYLLAGIGLLVAVFLFIPAR